MREKAKIRKCLSVFFYMMELFKNMPIPMVFFSDLSFPFSDTAID